MNELLCVLLLAPANLQVNGDLEQPGAAAPPVGFTMWGDQRWKDPANFTRDTTVAHDGAASLRIHHPADTAGYLVTDPAMAVRSTPATRYRVSFWARASVPVTGQFRFEAYQTVAPFVGAPVPLARALPLTPEWRRFEFEITESLDFFAHQARLLMLTFVPTTNPAVEVTLWVDTILWTAEPAGAVEGLVDPATLPVPALDHRLRPGDAARLRIDAGRTLRPVNRLVGGVSFHRLYGWTGRPYDREGRYALEPEHFEALRRLSLPMTRFYAVGVEPCGIEVSIDRIAALLDSLGVPHAVVPLELETQGATSSLPPEDWARAARHVVARGYGFRLWEVTNEPWVQHDAPPAFPDAESYLKHFLAVAAAVRAAQPDALLGLATQSRDLRWGNWLLRRAAGAYDWVTPHLYDFTDVGTAPLEQIAIGANVAQAEHLLRLRALLDAYNPGRRIPILDTEWGLHSRARAGGRADDEPRNGNLVGALHRGVRLIYYLREGLLEGASGWELFTFSRGPGFGFLFTDRPDTRGVLYWLMQAFNAQPGGWVLDLSGTAPVHEPSGAPLTPAVATLSDDGRLWLMIANADAARAIPVEVALAGYTAATVAGEVMTQASLDADPVLTAREQLVAPLPIERDGDRWRFVLPAKSFAFVLAERAAR